MKITKLCILLLIVYGITSNIQRTVPAFAGSSNNTVAVSKSIVETNRLHINDTGTSNVVPVRRAKVDSKKDVETIRISRNDSERKREIEINSKEWKKIEQQISELRDKQRRLKERNDSIRKRTLADGTDLYVLAKAVAWHETKDCGVKIGSALKNNCFGIMQWDKNRNRSFKRFDTKEESYEAFMDLWETSYKKFPDKNLASKYSGNDRSHNWLAVVKKKYKEYANES